ncbi:MAG: SsrA-binding protein SmpB [Proteobacteria bacterium]|nr:SsrA-binding protein SmpB [Pseudomonadota bacterium]NBY19590.1 SsrA-binding protein SmpB [bacterium]
MSETGGIKIISDNRKAFHNYTVEEKFEAGIVLKGTEVKSLREGKANLQDSYGLLKGGELFLLNAHIPPYKMGNRENHDPLRTRKLLLNRSELSKLWGKLETQGYSVIPLKMYFKKGLVKLEMGIAKGKKSHDKRQATKEKEVKRAMAKLTKKAAR